MISLAERVGRGLDWRGRRLLAHARSLLPRTPRPTILMYHRVADETFDPWGLAVSPANFVDQLSWLSSERNVLRLQEFAELHRRNALPADAIAITFDDGYACNAEVAAPLLERLRVPATIFLPVELIEDGEPFWWVELEGIVLEHDSRELVVDGERVDLGERSSRDRQWKPGTRPGTPRQQAFHDIHRRLVTRKPAEIRKSMHNLRRQSERANRIAPDKSPMTPEQVRERANSVVEFGSHALTHPWLTSLDAADQRHEIADSVERCRSLTGASPTALAYPFGMFDEQSEHLAEQAGFDCACSTESRPVSSASRMYALPRMQVGNWSGAKLGRRLAAL